MGANALQWSNTFPLGETGYSFKNNVNIKTQCAFLKMKKHSLASLTYTVKPD